MCVVILLLVITYIAMVIGCCYINAYLGVRTPVNFMDFIKLTCLPYVLYWVLEDINHLR